MRKRRHKFLRVLGWLVAAAAVVMLAGPYVAGWYLAGRLQAMVQGQLNAKVTLSRVSYRPPYTVHVGRVQLVVEDGTGTPQSLVELEGVTLKLAENPFGKSGPLVIERLDIYRPTIRLIQTDAGLLGAKNLTRSASRETPTKLSEIFRLRHLGIRYGQVEYQNRRSAAAEAGSQPMVWRGISVDLETQPQSASLYNYAFAAHDVPVAHMRSEGTFDIDDLVLQAQSLALSVRLGPPAESQGQQSVLPPEIQTLLAKYQVEGELAIDAAGVLPLRSPQKAMYQASVLLRGGRAYIPQRDSTLDLLNVKGTIQNEPSGRGDGSGHKIKIAVETLEAASGDNTLAISNAVAEVIPGVGWLVPDGRGVLELGNDHAKLAPRSRELLKEFDLSGKVMFGFLGSGAFGQSAAPTRWSVSLIPQGISARPPGFPDVLSNIRGGMISATENGIEVRQLTARYGRDLVSLEKATIPLKGLARQTDINDIAGTVTFEAASSRYPAAIEQLLDVLHPAGEVKITGRYSAVRSSPDEYDLLIESDRCELAPTKHRIPMREVQLTARVTPAAVEVRRFSASSLGGRVAAQGLVQMPPGRAMRYDASVAATDIDLRDLLTNYLNPDQAKQLIGRGFLSAKVVGSAGPGVPDPLAALTARGQAEVLDGQLWSAPVLDGIRQEAKVTSGLGGAQAAAKFGIANRMLTLKRMAVSSHALGVQGSGTVGFDGELRLKMVAAPLANWREDMKKTGIPVVSDVAGELVGGIQKLINTATRSLLYEFRVEGTVGKPQLRTVPTPVLTDSAALLFGQMLGGTKDKRLVDSLGEENGEKK